MLSLLRPVGEKIVLPRSASNVGGFSFDVEGYRTLFVESGTAALGLALSLLKERNPLRRKVIIPAYCCPDILSAALHSDLEPVVVDLENDTTYLSLESVETALGDDVLAIVGINFLGLPERIAALKNIADRYEVTVVEDSAQYLPRDLSSHDFEGELVVLSFGKGKPLSLLGGGALLISNSSCLSPVTSNVPQKTFTLDQMYRLKVLLYNAILTPLLYGFISRLPFLKIGETHYDPLTEIASLDGVTPLLVENYRNRMNPNTNGVAYLRERLDKLPVTGIVDLSVEQGVSIDCLLRYPLLVSDKVTRDRLLEALLLEGICATAMYKRCLVEIPGVPKVRIENGSSSYEASESFADRLITLPVHSDLTRAWVDRMIKVIALVTAQS